MTKLEEVVRAIEPLIDQHGVRIFLDAVSELLSWRAREYVPKEGQKAAVHEVMVRVRLANAYRDVGLMVSRAAAKSYDHKILGDHT